MNDSANVTHLLHAAGANEDARSELFVMLYDQLRGIAQHRLNGERAAHTLQATALVHEAFVKLVDHETPWENRAHFYGAAAQAMRRILVDHARARKAEKRGGDRTKVPLNVIDLAAEHDPDRILALDEAMTQLEKEDPRAASVVRMRFYAGLDVATTAQVLGLSERTVMRDWTYARAMLFDGMQGEPSQDDAS